MSPDPTRRSITDTDGALHVRRFQGSKVPRFEGSRVRRGPEPPNPPNLRTSEPPSFRPWRARDHFCSPPFQSSDAKCRLLLARLLQSIAARAFQLGRCPMKRLIVALSVAVAGAAILQ